MWNGFKSSRKAAGLFLAVNRPRPFKKETECHPTLPQALFTRTYSSIW
jgi:hypothetical protein